jgi:hypothetical protein
MLACLLAGFAGAGPAQQRRPEKPLRRPDSDQKKEASDWLVKLADDFVQYTRLPEGSLRPRLGVGPSGIALLYARRAGAHVDLYLARSSDEGATFSSAIRLNPTPGTVLAWNGTQSASVDVGPDEQVHVAWVAAGEKPSLQYVRVAPGDEMQPVLDLGSPEGLGTTTAVTVDAEGQVYLVYSASAPTPGRDGDPRTRVWLRRSTDGTTFGPPDMIDPPRLNVSTHSDISAHVDEVMGTVFVLYRTACQVKETSPVISRSLRLLSSVDKGKSFDASLVDNWKYQRDPHSSGGLSQEKHSTLATWDGEGRVYWSIIRRQMKHTNLPVEAKSGTRDVVRTHAVGAASGNEVLLSWFEEPEGDRKASPRLGWKVWLREGRFALGEGYAPEAPHGDGQVVIPRKAGGFTILY